MMMISPYQVRLQPDPFLNELTSMFERTTEKGSVWVTLKHCMLFLQDFPTIFVFLFFFDTVLNWDHFFILQNIYASASDKSKVARNKMKSAGEKIEFRCLIRATDGKKTISTMVK